MDKSKNLLKLMFVEGNSEHRILKINPRILKLAAWSIPFTTLVLLLTFASLSVILYKKINSIKVSTSEQSQTTVEQINDYKKNIEELQSEITNLNQKMLTPADNASSLQLFVTTKGFKDLTAQTLVNVENFQFSIQANTLDIKFELHNQSGLERTTGYFFVLTYTPDQLVFYPAIEQVQTELNFSQGETFNIGRFKNVIFKLPINNNLNPNQIKMKIVVFNRTGDLLFNKGFELQ
jgi:hypothetical protein